MISVGNTDSNKLNDIEVSINLLEKFSLAKYDMNFEKTYFPLELIGIDRLKGSSAQNEVAKPLHSRFE